METKIIKLDINNVDMDKLRYAAGVIRDGGLVAFPTETVYGLGANGLDGSAVEKIYLAKGRPSDNPLILHVAAMKAAEPLISEIPADAFKLMERFWPGPLTLVLKKSEIIPRAVTAGLDTVAVRIPSHPVALALIREAGVPVAAPSANVSGRPSPTRASHVIEDLYSKVDVIIDCGSSKVGLESTVLDMTVVPPMVLRPGGITISQLNEVIKGIRNDPALEQHQKHILKPKSPGMKYRHYSPKAKMVIIEGDLKKVSDETNRMALEYVQQGRIVGILATEQTRYLYKDGMVISLGDRENPGELAAKLFDALREFDGKQVDVIIAEAVDDWGIGTAVMNRMRKAAGYNIVKV